MVRTALPPAMTEAELGEMVPPMLLVTDDVIVNTWRIVRFTVAV